jgi:glycosyltransferase involved in cell wall biosynthesis
MARLRPADDSKSMGQNFKRDSRLRIHPYNMTKISEAPRNPAGLPETKIFACSSPISGVSCGSPIKKVLAMENCVPDLNQGRTAVEALHSTTAHQTGGASALLKVLVVAFNFPPDGAVGARRVAGFCRHFHEFGIQPIVLTVEERFYRVRDESVPVPQGVQVERTSFINLLRWYRRLRVYLRRNNKLSVAKVQKEVQGAVTTGKLISHQLVTLLDTPDEYWGWYFPAIRAAEELIRTQPIAAVWSTGPPWTPHLIARHLKKKYHIPWLADFRDPWTSDPWRHNLPQWRQRVDRKLESSCLRWADLVLSVTDSMRAKFEEQYPGSAAKFVTLTNGFDGSNFIKPRTTSQSPQRLFLHLGKLYGGRRIDTFCKALVDLIHTGMIDPAKIKVLFVGENDPAIVAGAQQVAPELLRNNCIEFRPTVPWNEARQFLDRADVLLIFQGELRDRVPGKFYEYLQTGKPIFAMGKQGDLSAILKTTCSGVWADTEDPEDIASKFVDALNLPVRSPEEVERLKHLYHFRSLTERLAGWIRILAGGAPRSQELQKWVSQPASAGRD